MTRHLAPRRGLVDGGGPSEPDDADLLEQSKPLRGEAEASTSFGRSPLPFEARGLGVSLLLAGALGRLGLPPLSLFEAVRNPSLSEIIGCHLDQNLVAGKHPDPVLAHPSRRMGDDLVFVLELHPEGGVGEQLGHTPGNSSISSFRQRRCRLFKSSAENGPDAAKSRKITEVRPHMARILPDFRSLRFSLPSLGSNLDVRLQKPATREMNSMRFSSSSWGLRRWPHSAYPPSPPRRRRLEIVKSADTLVKGLAPVKTRGFDPTAPTREAKQHELNTKLRDFKTRQITVEERTEVVKLIEESKSPNVDVQILFAFDLRRHSARGEAIARRRQGLDRSQASPAAPS